MFSNVAHQSLRTIFRKSQLVIFSIAFLMSTLTFVLISAFTMQTYAKQNLRILSTSLSEQLQPALVFQDQLTLDEILTKSTQQHSVRSVRVYDAERHQIAYSEKDHNYYSQLQCILDAWFFKDPIELDVQHNQQLVGHLVLYGSSEKILQFIITILFCLAIVLVVMTTAIWCSTNFTYRYIMKSIRPLMQTAQHVSDHKAYNLRFPQNNIREFQELNDVFNQLLKEIQCWHNDLQHQNHVLSFEARHDYLTGLPNRNYFYQKLHHLFDHTQHSQHAVMFFIDNNHFKSINDTYGHLAGDAVLMEMATRLKQKLRPDDFIARLGGDEFAIIVESVTQIEQIQSMAERLLETSHTPLYFKGQSICFSFSLGIAFSQFAHGPEEFISQADQAMYTAKGLAQQWFIYKP